MNHDQAFLDDICAHPDDDAPRLVYADWLDDHGQAERAEFIRVQCDIARLPVTEGRRFDLQVREAALLRANGRRWTAPLKGLGGKWQFRRGFVERGDLSVGRFCRSAAELYRLTPLRHVHLTGNVSAAVARKVAAFPGLAQLAGLRIWARELASVVEELAGSPHLRGLRELSLLGAPFGAAGARALTAATNLSGLESLHLFAPLGPEGAEALAEGRHFKRLATLILARCGLESAGMQALASSSALPALTHFELRSGPIGSAGALALAAWPRLAQLTRLELSYARLQGEALLTLVASPRLRSLNWLGLCGSKLHQAGCQALARSPHLAGLAHLDLGYCQLGDSSARALAASPSLANLLVLQLSSNRIGDAGARALLASPHLTQLRQVDLRWNRLTREQQRLLRKRLGKGAICKWQLGGSGR